MTARDYVQTLLTQIDASPTVFQAVETQVAYLKEHGFTELKREDRWELSPGDSRYIVVGDAAVLAFRVGKNQHAAFHIAGAHSDSPSYRLKANPDQVKEGMLQLNVEPYGGIIHRTWLDRPLSVAGRLILKKDGGLEKKNLVIDKDLLIIPSVAAHMDREVNDKGEIKPQKTMTPVYGLSSGDTEADFLCLVAEEAGVSRDAILEYDLYLYAREKGCLLGANEAFFSVGRIDDLAMAYAALTALAETEAGSAHQMVVINDNEEIGSGTLRGADSFLLRDVLRRITFALGGDEEDFLTTLAKSFLISCDQAHAVHPNYGEVADPTNRPRINEGPVIKMAANKSYNTDAESAARFRLLAEKAGVPVQTFHNHSDRRGGSTIGPITERWTTIPGVDVGNPMLSMHSVRELAGVEDHYSMLKILKVFFAK